MSFGAPVLICDGCGKKRGESNHWHSLRDMGHSLEIVRREVQGGEDFYYHACGDGCVILLVQKFLTAGELEAWRDPSQKIEASETPTFRAVKEEDSIYRNHP